MDEDQNGKDARMWRVGIVAPGCTPEMAMDPRALTDEEVAAVADEYSNLAPEEVVVFAFRSRSESFDERCATLAALVAVQIGKNEFGIGDVFGPYGKQIAGMKSSLRDQARICIDLRGKLQDARRRVVAAIAAGLVIGALLGGAAAFLLFSEHAPFRVADDHAREERAGRAEDFPGGDRDPVRKRGRLASVALGFVGAATREGDFVFSNERNARFSGKRDVHGQKSGFTEFVKESMLVSGVAGNGRAVAGGVAEDGELDVVHGLGV